MRREILRLDERLKAAAELVPDNSVLLDVGTDHGYLPAKLLLDGKIKTAGASDVNRGPLTKAVRTAEKYSVENSISFYLSDGFADIPDLEAYTCISICGMGGELISGIIDKSDYLRICKIPLVLQPMSSADKLSIYLAGSGFGIIDERIARASGKLYRVLFVRYDGIIRELTAAEHILGKINIEGGRRRDHFHELLLKYVHKYKRIVSGRTEGGREHFEASSVLAELCRIAEKEGIEIENI